MSTIDAQSASRNEQLIKNSFILSLGTFVPKVITVLILPLLTAYLTIAEYGNYDLILSATSLIVPIAMLQIQQGLFRYLISSRTAEQREAYLASSLVYVLAISAASVPIVYAVGRMLGLDSMVSLLMCALVAAESLYLLIGQALRGTGRNLEYSLGVICYSAVNAAVIFLLVYLIPLGLRGVVVSITAAYAVAAGMMLLAVMKQCRVRLRAVSKAALKELLRFSAPIVPSSISLWVVNLSNRFIIVYFLGAAANGIYSVANKIPALYTTAYTIFSLSWNEMAAKVADVDDKPEKYYSVVFEKLYSFLIGAMLMIIAASPLFYKIFVHAQYYDSYYQTAILYFGVFFNSLVMYYASIYIAIKKTNRVGYSSVVGAVINIVISLAGVSKFGLYAASVGTAVSYFAIALYRAVDINRYLRITYPFRKIAVGLLLMIVSSMAYYSRQWPGFLLCILLAVGYNLKENRDMIVWMKNKLLRRRNK